MSGLCSMNHGCPDRQVCIRISEFNYALHTIYVTMTIVRSPKPISYNLGVVSGQKKQDNFI